MKAVKLYLVVVSVLLVIALGLGVYVWYVFQDYQRQIGDEVIQAGDGQETVPTSEGIPETRPPLETNATPVVEEPIVIDATTLNETQRSILEGFGQGDASVRITQDMIVCAKEAVGDGRLTEILNGSAPSPLESMRLLPCTR